MFRELSHITSHLNTHAEWLYSYDRLFYSLYGYDGGTTRTYKYSFDLNPNWVNGRLESVNFNLHNAMFYPNSYLNFNNNGYYTKHYYNGMERIASRLGDRNISINVNNPELQDRKDWQDSLIRKNVTEITGYEFLPVGEEQNHEDPKPVFELPQVGMNGLHPIGSGSVYYYHSNHLGSTCYVTDGNATVQQGFLYAPFGEITNEYNNSFGNGVIPKYSFNAKELDEETGMYYYEARYMAPPVFISRDPLFEKYPTISPYTYCANNPVKFIDPTGEELTITGYDGTTYNWYKGELYVGKNRQKANLLPKQEKNDLYYIDNNTYNIIYNLNKMYKTKAGKIVLDRLCDSKVFYNISNKTKGDGGGGYSNKVIYLNNNYKSLVRLSHELFHAFQDDNGRNGRSIYNEVEAYIFQAIINDGEQYSLNGIKSRNGNKDYDNAGENILKSFSEKDFNYLLNNFRDEAIANRSHHKYPDGLYNKNRYDLNPLNLNAKNSLLKKIY